jgi:hypothetical protein
VGSSNYGGIYAWSLSHPTVRNSILWNNIDDIFGSAVTSSYSCIKNPDTGTGNIHTDPLFRTGPLGNYYLSQILAGQSPPNSPCLNGSIDAVTAIYNPWQSYTTRTDYAPDDPNTTVDIGYHYPTAGIFKQYRLITSVVGAPNGHGTITPNYASPGQLINAYTNVGLTATPADANHEVEAWHGTSNDSSTSVNNAVIMDANKTVTVKFRSTNMPMLTTVNDGNGTLAPVTGPQRQDTDIQLTANPITNYRVSKWSGTNDNNSTALTNKVTMAGPVPRTVKVWFEPNLPVSLNTQVIKGSDGLWHGTVSPRSRSVQRGTPVILTANPETNYKVDYWQYTDNDSCSTSMNKITMHVNTTVYVKFKLKPTYTLTVNASPSNLGTPAPTTAAPYYEGDVVTIAPNPKSGYMVGSWDGTDLPPNQNKVTMTRNKTVTVHFVQNAGTGGIIVKNAAGAILDSTSTTIQNAINLAQVNAIAYGDMKKNYTVLVPPGLWKGAGNRDLKLKGLPLTIRSTDPNIPDQTVIDCEGQSRGITFTAPNDPCDANVTTVRYTLSGFTIINGNGNTATGNLSNNGNGGGILTEPNAILKMNNCIIQNCQATVNGGGIFIGQSSLSETDVNKPVITLCKITNNTTGGSGGGIYCDLSALTLRSSEISYNSATAYPGYGGGFYGQSGSTPAIINCLFHHNSAANWGGAIHLNGSKAIIELCTIVYNSGLDLYGGIYARGSQPTIDRCIIGRSDSTDSNYPWVGGGTSSYAGIDLFGGTTTFSDIESAPSGQLSANPLFVTGISGDYYLSQLRGGQSTDSPCVDASPPFYLETLETDYGLEINITTAILNKYDIKQTDIGYHYPFHSGTGIQYELQLKTIGNGTLYAYVTNGDNTIHYNAPGSYWFTPGTRLTLIATPGTGQRVKKWTGTDDDSTFSIYNAVTLYHNPTVVTAEFELKYQSIIHVPGAYPYVQIQQAIDQAKDGDIIVIDSGRYIGTGFTVSGKNLTITGTNPNDPNVVARTIIDCNGENSGGFHLYGSGSGSCVLSGLTIMNLRTKGTDGRDGKNTGDPGNPGADNFVWGSAVTIWGNHKVLNCIIRDANLLGGTGGNGSAGGSGTSPHPGGKGGDAGDAAGAGILVLYGNAEIENCTFDNCMVKGGIGGNGGNGNNDETFPVNSAVGGRGGMPGRAFGGAICVSNVYSKYGYSFTPPNATIENCIIRNCKVIGGQGGNGGNTGFHAMPSSAGAYGTPTYSDPTQDPPINHSANGGAVYIDPCSNVTLTNCTIVNNSTDGSISGLGGLSWEGVRQQPLKNTNIPSLGAGIYSSDYSDLTISNCTIQGNRTAFHNDLYSGYGGGIAVINPVHVEIQDSEITGNSASVGGGFYGYSIENFEVNDINAADNFAYIGGGLFIIDSNTVNVSDSIIKRNLATANAYYTSPDDANSSVDEALFGSGGGIYCFTSDANISNCTITENTASGSGGGIYLGGEPLSIYPASATPELFNCLIAKNAANIDGGGLSVNWGAVASISNCTVTENDIGNIDYGGGGLSCSYGSTVNVTDSIFWGNIGNKGSQISITKGNISWEPISIVNIAYSDIDLRSGAELNPFGNESSTSSDVTGTTLVDEQRIYNEINSSGSAKVIVTLSVPVEFQSTDWSSSLSTSSLQNKVATLQAQVLSTLNTSEFTLQHKLTNAAIFSGNVTVNGLNKLLSNPIVAHIEPVRATHFMLAQGIPLMNALATRSLYNGQGVSIAIVDSGVDYTHPKLGGGSFPNSKVIGGYDTADNDADPRPSTVAHGTCCAGIAAGLTGSVGDYIGGVAYNAKLYALKISPDLSDSPDTAAELAAWDWCITHRNDDPANPIKVISNSWGIPGLPFNNKALADAYLPSFTAIAQTAVNAGITIFAASGNDGFAGQGISWPAAMSNVISVGAVYDAVFTSSACGVSTQPDKITCYSNTSNILDVLASSENAYTTDIVGSGGSSTGDYYPYFNGTSAACPYAAGAAAALQSAAKQQLGHYLTPTQVKTILTATGVHITDTKVAITKPRINLGNAIAMLTSSVPIYVEQNCTLTGFAKDVNDAWKVASGSNNISDDPNFVLGYYLSDSNAGQDYNSPCINIGSTLAATLGLNTFTTRTDGKNDTGLVDMGFHYTSGLSQCTITVKILSDTNYPGIHGRITADPNKNRVVSSDSTTVTYTFKYYAGTKVTFTAIRDTGSFMKGWYDETYKLITINDSITITVDSNDTYYVRFKQKQTIPVSGGGTALRNAVNAAENGDTLVVSSDTYNGNINIAGKQLKIHGINPDDPNIIQKVIIDCGGGAGFIISGNVDRNTVIDGFTIVNGGYSTSQSAIFIDANCSPLIVNVNISDSNVITNGAAIYIGDNSSPEFENVDISNCRAVNGGGVYIGSKSSPIFTDCSIVDCRASGNGGAVYCNYESSPTFNSCRFTRNIAADSAGAIFYYDLCTIILANCDFAGNSANNFAGALMCRLNGEMQVDDCNFSGNIAANTAGAVYMAENCSGKIHNTKMTGNIATADGGAIYITDSNTIEIADCIISKNRALRGGGIFALSSPEFTIRGCNISYNNTPDSNYPDGFYAGEGGGLYSFDGPAMIEDCQFVHNTTIASGGGVYFGGPSEPNMHNCLIIGNNAKRDGGGVSVNWETQLTLSNCTIANNNVIDGASAVVGYGGGLSCAYDANTTIINSILWDNIAKYGSEISIGSNFDAAMKQKAKVSVSYSDVKGGLAGTFVDIAHSCIFKWKTGNLLVNPLFVTGYWGDYYLSQKDTADPLQTANTPCLDTGSGSALSRGMYKHTTRTDHVIDFGTVDMGYHYTLTTDLLGDLNFDGAVNLQDLALLMLYWLDNNCSSPYWCYGTDINGDGKVDFEDFALFAENYGMNETVPPIPNPMTWSIMPRTDGLTSVTMTATNAVDNSGAVKYYFKCVSGGGHDRDWGLNRSYTDTGLTTDTEYGYQVKARDMYLNETGWSNIGLATPGILDTNPPKPDPMTWATVPYASSATEITMVATDANDASGVVEYNFVETSGHSGGRNSGWQTAPNYSNTGLSNNTIYIYKVKARDKFHNETGYSPSVDANTGQIVIPPPVDNIKPTPNPSQWASVPTYIPDGDGIHWTLTMTAATATDPAPASLPVQYYFECLSSGGTDSGWVDNPTWELPGFLARGTVTYIVYTRDSASPHNVTDPSPAYTYIPPEF